MGKYKVSKYVVLILICCLIGVLCSKFFFEGQIKEIIKERISHQVCKNESTLEELVADISERSDLQNIHRSERGGNTIVYKDLDNPLFTKVFNKFHLIMISNGLDRLEDQYVAFYISSNASLLWNGYSYGFYYSSSNEPIDVVYGKKKCETEFEGEIGFYSHYYYKTNQIAENWWYYECTVSTNSNIQKR